MVFLLQCFVDLVMLVATAGLPQFGWCLAVWVKEKKFTIPVQKARLNEPRRPENSSANGSISDDPFAQVF